MSCSSFYTWMFPWGLPLGVSWGSLKKLRQTHCPKSFSNSVAKVWTQAIAVKLILLTAASFPTSKMSSFSKWQLREKQVPTPRMDLNVPVSKAWSPTNLTKPATYWPYHTRDGEEAAQKYTEKSPCSLKFHHHSKHWSFLNPMSRDFFFPKEAKPSKKENSTSEISLHKSISSKSQTYFIYKCFSMYLFQIRPFKKTTVTYNSYSLITTDY